MLCQDYTKKARMELFKNPYYVKSAYREDYADLTEVIIDEQNSQIAAWSAVICSVLGCFGNILTIIVLLRKTSLRRHSTTPFLLSLALSDLLFCVFNLPLMAVRWNSCTKSWPRNRSLYRALWSRMKPFRSENKKS